MKTSELLGVRQKIINFLMEHQNDYTKEEKDFIIKNYSWGFTSFLVPDILRQIYDELDILPTDKNIYMTFLKLLKEKFDINRDIVELGGGKIPCLGKKIALAQKKGTITVYDDKLISLTSPYPNLTLKNEMLKENTNLKQDMLVAFMPCEGTETAIHLAGKNNLDFMIALCEGPCHTELEWEYIFDNWEQNIFYEAKKTTSENKLGQLEIIYMKKNPYPIIYNKR